MRAKNLAVEGVYIGQAQAEKAYTVESYCYGHLRRHSSLSMGAMAHRRLASQSGCQALPRESWVRDDTTAPNSWFSHRIAILLGCSPRSESALSCRCSLTEAIRHRASLPLRMADVRDVGHRPQGCSKTVLKPGAFETADYICSSSPPLRCKPSGPPTTCNMVSGHQEGQTSRCSVQHMRTGRTAPPTDLSAEPRQGDARSSKFSSSQLSTHGLTTHLPCSQSFDMAGPQSGAL